MKYRFLVMTNLRGQSIIQYMAIMAIVTVSVAAMGTGVRRTIQAAYKNVTDEIGPQTGFSPDPRRGFVDRAVTQDLSTSQVKRTEQNGIVILERDKTTNIPVTHTTSHYGKPPD